MEKQAAEKAVIAREIEDRLNKGEDPEVLAEEYKDELFSSFISSERIGSSVATTSYNQWIFDAGRKVGDVNLSEYVSTSVHNYSVVRFEGRELVESPTANVRHMLIAAGEGSDAANPTDAQYDEALKKAEALLEDWKKGEATEDSFATMANTYSEDPGSNTTGGLYEAIDPFSSYVPEFLSWAVDGSRQTGDTDIIKTSYGYHIMYFVSGQDYFYYVVGEQLVTDRIQTRLAGIKNKYPIDVNYKKVVLCEPVM